MNFLLLHFIIALTCVSATTAFLAIFVIWGGRWKEKLYRIFAFYSLSITWWSLTQLWLVLSKKSTHALFWARFEEIGVFFIPTAFVHFVLTFLKIQNKKWLIRLAYLISIFFASISFSPYLIANVKPSFFVDYWTVPGPVYHFAVFFFIVLIIYGLYELVKACITASGVKRTQILYLCLGSIIGYGGGLGNFLLSYNIHIPFIVPFGTYGVGIYCVIMAYAIYTYRLLDITVGVTNAGIFAVVYTFVLGIPLGLAGWGRPWLESIFGSNWYWVPLLLAIILATPGPSIFIFFQKKAESEILKNKRRNLAILLSDVQHIPFVKDLEKLCNSIVNMATGVLDAAFASIYLFDRERKIYSFYTTKYGKKRDIKIESGNSMIKYLINVKQPIVLEELKREYDRKHDVFMKETLNTINKLNTDVIVPFLVEEDLIGFLALGFKKSGEIYSTDDLNVLANLASQAALAIENAQFLKEREEIQGKLREAETLSSIRDLLGSVNHEFHNLLLPIAGMLGAIAFGDYEKKPDKLIPDARKQYEKALFSKTYLSWITDYVTSGDKMAAYQLRELVNGGISYSKDTLGKQNIKTQIDINHKIFIIGYESLPLLFRNLILHSVYGYGMESEGTITISARILEDGATVEIIQLDTGHDLTKYLEEHSTCGGKKFAEKGKLGGVNYYIAQAIVSKHKGTLKVEPTGGKGTKFNIQLPLDFNKIP